MRIDIRLISKKSYPFALLYFTGSKKTNTFMRNQAIKLGFKLNEYSLINTDTSNNSDSNIYLNSEEEIFKFLKLDYIKPQNR